MEDAIANGIDCPQAYPSQFWYHADIAGHTEFVTDLAGMPYEHFFYLPFGEVAVHQHANNDGYSNPYQFSSSEFDDATGLILMGARYYDPMFSLWMSADPLSSFRSWLTPYNYVANNPVMFVDPSGLLESSIKTGDENPGDFPPCEETSLQEMSPFPLFWAAFYLALANYLSSDSDDVIVTDDDGKDWTREDLEELLAQADANKENQLALASTNPKFVARAESSLQDDEAKNCPNCPIPSRSFLASNMQEGITTYAGDGEGNFVYYHPDGTVEFDDTGDPGDKILSEATGTALMIAPAVQINQARTALSTVDEVVDAADEGAEYIDDGLRFVDEAQVVLEGAVESNFRRFIRKMPANAKSSASYELLDDGNYLFEATSPGRVPGSKAVYQKWVNSLGETYKMIKTTFAPDGSIIHVIIQILT